MKHMGWSWADLCATPADVVAELVVLLNEAARQAALDAGDPEFAR